MDTTATAPEMVRCRRCHRPLHTATARALGLGSRCAAIEAATSGLNAKQAAKARNLAASGQIRKVRDGVYKVPSGSGKDPYLTFTDGNCMCAWGLHRKPGDKVCYHVGAARLTARPRMTPRRAATRRQFVAAA